MTNKPTRCPRGGITRKGGRGRGYLATGQFESYLIRVAYRQSVNNCLERFRISGLHVYQIVQFRWMAVKKQVEEFHVLICLNVIRFAGQYIYIDESAQFTLIERQCYGYPYNEIVIVLVFAIEVPIHFLWCVLAIVV